MDGLGRTEEIRCSGPYTRGSVGRSVNMSWSLDPLVPLAVPALWHGKGDGSATHLTLFLGKRRRSGSREQRKPDAR